MSMVSPMPGRGRVAEMRVVGLLANSTMRWGWEGESGERGEQGERRPGPLFRGRYSQLSLLMMLFMLVVLLQSSSFVCPVVWRDRGLPTRGLLLPLSKDGLVREAVRGERGGEAGEKSAPSTQFCTRCKS